MQNLRIVSVKIINSTSIEAKFTASLTNNLVTSNVSIISEAINVPDSKIIGVTVNGNILTIECLPLTSLANYYLEFKSVPGKPFVSVNGQDKILEDGVSNKYYFIGPSEPNNPITSYLFNFFKQNIYNIEDETTLSGNYIRSLSNNLVKALYDIRQVKNENYLSIDIIDENKIRGEGPFDRLNEGGAYEIIRVGQAATGTNVSKTLSFLETPYYPITLQREIVTEYLKPGSIDESGKFNINDLILNLNKSPVTKLNKIIFTINSSTPIYEYPIDNLGYQIFDSKYDQEYGFTYPILKDNQIKLSDQLLANPLFDINNILNIEVQYEFKNLGTIIGANSLSVYTKYSSIREVIPPIINVFNLKHAPIVDSDGKIYTFNGVNFTDPNNVPGSVHPAFKNEIPFRLDALPTIPGQYSIDYTTGTVYVYGEDVSNDGTGPYPPLASYDYKFTFKEDQDYAYDISNYDIVALPIGNLVGEECIIDFNFEQVLIPDIDYVAKVHKEILSERIENRITSLNSIRVKNAPITNVFRVYNETSGEIYTIDRWNNDKIYIRYGNAPNVENKNSETVQFTTINNELLFVDSIVYNSSFLRIFKILLKNNRISSQTEDSLGSSINSSVNFSNINIFSKERWFNQFISQDLNLDILSNAGEYCIDYINGIVYCAVSNTQSNNIGTATYKISEITLQKPHVISVNDIYYQIDPLGIKNKQISYISFKDGFVLPNSLEYSDESALNNVQDSVYQLLSEEVGSFVDGAFISGVTNQVKFVRGIFEYDDLTNSTNPINFANYTQSNNFNITVGSYIKNEFHTINFDGTNYFILLNDNIPYLSPNIAYNFNVVRVTDNKELWDSSGTIIPGNPVKLILSGINYPAVGDLVNVFFNFSIVDLSRVIIDYNKGELFIDYTYLADEIIVSYEYGDNVIDFRTSTTVPTNTGYYVSYKAGALRDALLKNFGNLVNIPELTSFDLNFDRERYRDALTAAMTSFIQGPTITAIKNIGKTISHIEPEVVESAFTNWSLGSSLLSLSEIKTTGEFSLVPAKFDNGALINSSNQTITLPASSNLRFEEGTFETWISPQWDGLDNDAELTFTITKDGDTINPIFIFIGASEYHPALNAGKFKVNKNTCGFGSPNFNKDGVFIYYDKDQVSNFNRWYVKIVDGYINGYSSNYKINILSDGIFYDSKSITTPKPSSLNVITGLNHLTLNIIGGSSFEEGITFVSDIEHYILDFGQDKNINRLSIFKDASGYLNFKVFDKHKGVYSISSDISSWKVRDLHHIAASWKLNSKDNRDEMHLFIDGLEVPNIIKYGQKVQPYLHEKFRTVTKEEVLGLSNKDIIASTDLKTIENSPSVSSSINFSAYNISIGDLIFIDEIGFNESGYTIIGISGQTLTLNQVMPLTLSNARFSINRTQFVVSSDIDVSANITVSRIPAFIIGSNLIGNTGSNILSCATVNFTNLGVEPGDSIKIDNPSINDIYTIIAVSGNTISITDDLSISLLGANFQIYKNNEVEIPGMRALFPSYSISKGPNYINILTISNNIFANDLILIRTLGLNHRTINHKYYVWSNNTESMIMTKMPPPISLDEVKITKIILPSTVIGINNSTLSGGIFYSNNLTVEAPSNSQNGRTISATISGNNVDFSVPVSVTINGLVGIYTISETITFTDYGTLDFSNLYLKINYIKVEAKPININKPAVVVECKEKYPITYSESGSIVPVIKYSYYINGGFDLYSTDGYTVTDNYNLFNGSEIDNKLIISSPPSSAGFYKITDVSSDRKSLTIASVIPSSPVPIANFTAGTYQIINTTEYRSGFQNGFFSFELDYLPSEQYFLSPGFYDIQYETYTRINMSPVNVPMFIGSDFRGKNQINSVLDQVKIYSVMLTDTRVGESIPKNQRSVTKDFNSLKPLQKDANTLALLSFDSYPFTNNADTYTTASDLQNINKYFQSSIVVNENFNNSIAFLDKPLELSNDGILNPKNQGTIEFWINPLFDTGNDPNERYYFDAFGATLEETVSTDAVSVKLSSPASKIISVKLKNGDPRIDYFAGGSIEIDTQNAIQEAVTSSTSTTVIVNKNILQIVKVEVVGDLSKLDYFNGGSVSSDKRTIYLGKELPGINLPVLVTYKSTDNKNIKINSQIIRLNRKLPYQNSEVVVNYVPKGLQGDRLSIFKDKFGYMNFSIIASGNNYLVQAPIRWSKNSWHRVKASYKVNSGQGNDEMRLFLDGYEYSKIIFTTDINASSNFIINNNIDGYNLIVNIKFKDSINNLYIGSQYDGQSPIFSLLDNLRISDKSRPIYAPYGYPIDINYNSNLEIVYPVTADLYTTYLLNFDSILTLNTDFAVIKNRNTGSFDFSVNILDSFGIVNNSPQVQAALEKLIKVLKPANSKVFIKYIR